MTKSLFQELQKRKEKNLTGVSHNISFVRSFDYNIYNNDCYNAHDRIYLIIVINGIQLVIKNFSHQQSLLIVIMFNVNEVYQTFMLILLYYIHCKTMISI
jgi:hypothetical protein